MNKKISNSKTRSLQRESRPEKVKKDSKNEKSTPLNKKLTLKEDKYRSGSLNRNYAGTSRESPPRKSVSVERKPLNKSTPKKDSVVKAQKPTVNKRNSVEVSSKMHQKPNENKQKISTSSKPVHKSRTNEKRTNAEIAKSFVQNAAAVSNKKRTPSHEAVQDVKGDDESQLDRPRTSTIRKEYSLSIEEKGEKIMKRSASKNKVSSKEDSEEDKASYEDDFEDYNSDFEESESDSSLSDEDDSYDSIDQQENFDDLEIENAEPLILASESPKHPINNQTEIQMVKKVNEKSYLKMSDRTSLNSKNSVDKVIEQKAVKVSRSFINFASAVQSEEQKEIEHDSYNSRNELDISDEISNNLEALKNMSFMNQYKNTKQVYVQTEIYESDEIQTDEIKTIDKWSQNPLNGTLGYGGDKVVYQNEETIHWKLLYNPNSAKLSSFLQRSSNIILTLLDEESSFGGESSIVKKRQNFFHSKGYYTLPTLSFLKDLPIVHIYSSPESSPYILTVHGNMTKLPSPSAATEEKGVICVWNVMNSKKPEHILTSNSQPICGTFGPGGSDLVIAGMVDGAVMLWDLTSFNSEVAVEESGILLPLLSSTYNTALILGDDNHSSCIVGIQAVYNQTDSNWKSNASVRSNYARNFHVLTLEEMGVINIWVVVEVLKPDISGLETDLGLAPGGKYRLVKSSSIHIRNLTILHLEQKENMRTFDFRLVPQDSSRILVTTDIGLVLHMTRHSGTVEPRYYSNESELTYEVRCIEFSPHNKDLFLIGCSDGTMKLYNIKIVKSLIEFLCTEKGESIIFLQWSTIFPSMFFVLNSSSCIHRWNLIEDSVHPVQIYQFQDCKITWFVIQTMENKSNQPSSEKCFNFLVSKENGELEVHTFKERLTNEEYIKQFEYMQSL